MPSATNSAMASNGGKAGGEAAAAPSPAAASAAAAAAVSGGTTSSVQTEAMKQILGVIDKKLRNLEKKKVRTPPSPSPPRLLLWDARVGREVCGERRARAALIGG